MKTNLQSFQIPFENDFWSLMLNDPWYQQHEDELHDSLENNFSADYQYLKNNFRQISGNKREVQLLKELSCQLQIDKQVHVFECNSYCDLKTVVCKYYDNNSIFIISRPINKDLPECELIPLFAHELGHWIFKTPFPLPFDFLYAKLKQATILKEQDNILRMFYLTDVLNIISEYNADRLALWLTSFESLSNAHFHLCRLNNRFYKFNMKFLIQKFPHYMKTHQEFDLKKYLSTRYRINAMFLFSHEHNRLESENLRNFKPKMTITDLLDPNAIIKTYHEILEYERFPDYAFQYRKEQLEYLFTHFHNHLAFLLPDGSNRNVSTKQNPKIYAFAKSIIGDHKFYEYASQL
jgi:hypothetical protein